MHQVDVLVISCDRYQDLWRPFFSLFFRHWPDCPYRVTLGSNHAIYDDSRVNRLAVGPDRAWGANLLAMLSQLRGSHVITFLDDFLIEARIENMQLDRLVEIAIREDLGCLRLIPNPGPSRRIPRYSDIGEIGHHDAYRISTQAAIWDREILTRLIRPDYTPWRFELDSTRDRAVGDRFWCVYRPVIKYRHGVERGKWLPQGLRICQHAEIPVDRRLRPTMTRMEALARQGRICRGAPLRLLRSLYCRFTDWHAHWATPSIMRPLS